MSVKSHMYNKSAHNWHLHIIIT